MTRARSSLRYMSPNAASWPASRGRRAAVPVLDLQGAVVGVPLRTDAKAGFHLRDGRRRRRRDTRDIMLNAALDVATGGLGEEAIQVGKHGAAAGEREFP